MPYKRNLPHWHPEGKVLFVTWRLAGSLPAGVWGKHSRRAQARMPVPPKPGAAFRAVDRELDKGHFGPLWLRDPRIAQLVVDLLQSGHKAGLYELHAYVVMPNHVHVLLRPNAPLARITRVLKGVSARRANKLLCRTGKTFWLDESFDHWVRSESEFWRIVSYIEMNPVSAGLVARAGDWSWSSAGTPL